MVKKLEVDFKQDINNKNIGDRKYTLTHSDKTGQRYLFIGNEFAKDRYNRLRDEVIGQWSNTDTEWELNIMCNLYSEYSDLTIEERYEKFRSHMPRAITAIVNGDREYLKGYSLLEHNVYVHFLNGDTTLKEYFGRVNDYIDTAVGTN